MLPFFSHLHCLLNIAMLLQLSTCIHPQTSSKRRWQLAEILSSEWNIILCLLLHRPWTFSPVNDKRHGCYKIIFLCLDYFSAAPLALYHQLTLLTARFFKISLRVIYYQCIFQEADGYSVVLQKGGHFGSTCYWSSHWLQKGQKRKKTALFATKWLNLLSVAESSECSIMCSTPGNSYSKAVNWAFWSAVVYWELLCIFFL